jgi:hypothetical protein
LFFTDNLNQPRKINVQKAIDNPAYYTDEQKISVAKFAPFYPIRLLDSTNSSTMSEDSSIESDFLKNQFVRFSYRFKYVDGEYSIMAPFTQAVFIPKIYQNNATGLTAGQITKIFDTSEVEDMVNFINKVVFKIQLPSTASTVIEDNAIEKIQILSRVDGDLSVRVIDDIDAQSASISSGILNYTYKSFEPFKTLPEDQITRVFDNVPLRAKSQEIVGNRVVYGNYTENRNLNNTVLDFDVDTSLKNAVTSTEDDYLYNEYKYHSVKQRRKYQIGIVLSDIFGRQTPVLLPQATSTKTSTERSSVFVPAKDPLVFSSKVWDDYANNSTNTTNWGDVLRIIFNQPISNVYSSSNPYGWYSYRIVVKQQEQEYYNVYTTGMARQATNIGFINLNGDNVNKIPRDVTDISRETGIAGSEARIYPKVINHNNASTAFASLMSNGDLFDVLEIGTATEFGFDVASAIADLVDEDKGLLLAKLPANQTNFPAIGSRQGKIAVFETEPFNSKLDIFYETSSAGLVSDLNTAITASLTGITSITATLLLNSGGTGLTEATTAGSLIAEVFASNDSGIQNAAINLVSVLDSQGNNVTSSFSFNDGVSDNKIKTVDEFYYGLNGEVYSFKFTTNFASEDFTEVIDISLQNVIPTITLTNNPIFIENIDIPIGTFIALIKGSNGSVKEGFEFSGLEFQLANQTNNGGKYAISTSGNLTNITTLTGGQSDTITIKLIDSDGVTEQTTTLTINTGSNQYSQFYTSSVGYNSISAAQNQATTELKYHTGVGNTPIVNDFVYKYFVNQNLYQAFDTQGQFYTMSENPSSSAILSFKTDSTGKVTEISTQ